MAYTTKSVDQIKANIILNIIQNVSEINDANVGSVLDYFATAFSQEIEEQYGDLDDIYTGTRISTATEDDLDELGTLLGVDRNLGSKASGFVTFRRNAPASPEFTISADKLIATQPDAENTQFQFIIKNDVTFKSSITDETQTFRNGVYDYKLDQRFIDSLTSIDGTVSAAPNTFIQGTDYSLVEDFDGTILDLTNFSLVNDCETIGDWSIGDEADTPTDNTSEYYQGTQSLNMLKSGTISSKLSYSRTLPSVISIVDKEAFVMVYIKDATELAKILKITIWNGSSSGLTNSLELDYLAANLIVGWNRLSIDRTSASNTVNGNPDAVNINYLKIEVTTSANSDTFVAGDLMMDMWFLANSESYEGMIVRFDKDQTQPDTNTDIVVDYVPLSYEVEVEADEVGVGYNVAKGTIIFKVSNFPNTDRIYNYKTYTNGINLETDDVYRDRIQNATQLKTNATIDAIRYNVLDLDYVQSCTVIDTPDKSTSNENIIFNTGVDKYTLLHEVAQDNVSLIVGNSLGSSDYVNGTDFILTEENEIDFGIGGVAPSDTATFYVSYGYKWLGHFFVYVVGDAGSLTALQLQEVEDVVEDTRSAGTVPHVIEPTYVSIDISLGLTIDPTFTEVTIQDNTETAIESYINSLGTGGDVLLAGVISAAMAVDGVTNVSITDIAGGGVSDYTIDEDEVAQSGVISIS